MSLLLNVFKQTQDWREVDDETGATAIYGDFTSTGAFFVATGVNLSSFQDGNHRVILHDSGGKTAIGYISATAPSGETLGSELVTNGNFAADTNWTKVNVNIAGGVATFDGTSNARIYQNITLAENKLYKVVWNYVTRNSTGGDRLLARLGTAGAYADGPYYTSTGVKTDYLVAKANPSLIQFQNGGVPNDTNIMDDASVKQVTDPPATGARIVSTKGGATRAWASKDSGFDPNDITSFEVQIFD